MRLLLMASAVLAIGLGFNTASANFIDVDLFVDAGPEIGSRSVPNTDVTIGGGKLNANLVVPFAFDYELVTISGMGPFDFATTETPIIRLAGVDAGGVVNPGELRVQLNSGLAGASTVQSITLTAGVNDYDFDFGSYANLNAVENIRVSYTGLSNTFSIKGLHAVPEPTTLALIGLASAGGAIGFRRRKKAGDR